MILNIILTSWRIIDLQSSDPPVKMQGFIISYIHGGNYTLAQLLFPGNISYYCIIRYNTYTIHINNIDTYMGQYTYRYRYLVKPWLASTYIYYISHVLLPQ